MEKDKPNIEEKLNTFLKDIDILEGLNNLETEDNLFDILKISEAEIRHSNVLAWLLDPQKSKEVGKFFLRKLFILMMDRMETFNAADLTVDNFDDVEVRREWLHTDILVILRKKGEPNFVFCIENKVNSKQGKEQLETYRKCLESQPEFKEVVKKKRICYLFLRVKDESPNDKNWIEIDYNDVGKILNEALTRCSMSQDSRYFITQYLSTLRKKGMMDDQEMMDLAQKIYNKHKEALDYIYNNAQNEDALKFNHYHKWLDKNDFIKCQNNTSSALKFSTKELYSQLFKGIDISGQDLVPYCFYEIQKRSMNSIKLVLHTSNKDNDEGKFLKKREDIKNRLHELRKVLVNKNNDDWEWASAGKKNIDVDSYFNNHDVNDDDDDELMTILNASFKACESDILKKF